VGRVSHGVILARRCNVRKPGARAKLSPESVDKSVTKLAAGRNFPCFRPASSGCLFFVQIYNPLM
jgi:hypothetical protein